MVRTITWSLVYDFDLPFKLLGERLCFYNSRVQNDRPYFSDTVPLLPSIVPVYSLSP